jgi:hypothetical protein
MVELQKRIFEGFELLFWRSAVRLLKLTSPLKKLGGLRVEDLRNIPAPALKSISPSFSSGLMSATLGWGIGIAFGYFLALWAM